MYSPKMTFCNLNFVRVPSSCVSVCVTCEAAKRLLADDLNNHTSNYCIRRRAKGSITTVAVINFKFDGCVHTPRWPIVWFVLSSSPISIDRHPLLVHPLPVLIAHVGAAWRHTSTSYLFSIYQVCGEVSRNEERLHRHFSTEYIATSMHRVG